MLFCAVLLCVPFPATFPRARTSSHPASVSRSICRAEPGVVQASLRLQALSLVGALPQIDPDGDRHLSPDELSVAFDSVGDYLLRHWRLLLPPFGDDEGVPGKLVSLRVAEDSNDFDRSFQWIDAELEFHAEDTLEDLVVVSDLFGERDPYHRDFLSFAYRDEPPWEVVLGAGNPRWHFRSARLRSSGVRRRFFLAGLEEGNWRVLLALFFVALVASARGTRHAIGGLALVAGGVVAGFAFGVFAALPSERFLALALPLALAWLGAENLMRRSARTAVVEAPVFGALCALSVLGLHAGDLEREPLGSSAKLALLAAVLTCAALAFLSALALVRLAPGSRTRAGDTPSGLAAQWLFLAASTLAVFFGLGIFALHAGWI